MVRLLDVQQIGKRMEARGVSLSTASIYRLADQIPLRPTGPKKALRAREEDLNRWLEDRCGLEMWG